MNDLETRLREVDVPEPPLGFDPDEVADHAARHVRRRRAGIAVAAVAAASVVTAVLFAPGPAPEQLAGPPLPPSPAEQARIDRAFTDALVRVLPGRRSLTVGRSSSDALTPGRLSTSALFVDAAGLPGSLQLTVRSALTAQQVEPPGQACSEAAGVEQCTRLPLPGGRELVIAWRGYEESPGVVAQRVDRGALYRPDGSTVTVLAGPGTALTKDQLTQVIADPAFALR
ncbi:hypothetical protein [Amycolatopsis sp. cmx-4-68]|uniref:hypothetical protein n=1 Tax=Amycolatopsis sp. cmx-4-68 TaxID=2790938 RepID=UPI00397DDC0A